MDFKRNILPCEKGKLFCTIEPETVGILSELNIVEEIIQVQYCQLDGSYGTSKRAYPVGRMNEWIFQDAFKATQVIEKLDQFNRQDWFKYGTTKATYWQIQNRIYLIEPDNSTATAFADAIKKELNN